MRISDWSSDVCSSDLRDGFWLARWLRARGIETHVIHSTSIPVPRTHRRPKSDRLDTGLLKRSFLGWLRGERGHCTMAPVPTLSEEAARRPNREHSSLTGEQTRKLGRASCGTRVSVRVDLVGGRCLKKKH